MIVGGEVALLLGPNGPEEIDTPNFGGIAHIEPARELETWRDSASPCPRFAGVIQAAC